MEQKVIDSKSCDPLVGFEPTLTQQSFKEETDINVIVARVLQGRDIEHVNQRVAQFGDVSNVPSFTDAQNFIAKANQMFMDLSWQTREKFHNNPQELLDFMKNPDNYEEGVKLGILAKRQDKPADAGASVAPSGAKPVEPVGKASGGSPAQ